jgi:hypothetical protein
MKRRRRFGYQTAAWLLVWVFACVPPLSRMHDHLSATDQPTRLKFSKNIERPRGKYSPAPEVAIHAASTNDGPVPGEQLAAPETPLPRIWILTVTAPVRAPPVR